MQMSKFINESWWRGIRCGLPPPICTHNDPTAIEVFHFFQWGWLRQGHGTGTVLCHSILISWQNLCWHSPGRWHLNSKFHKSKQVYSRLLVASQMSARAGLLWSACQFGMTVSWLLSTLRPWVVAGDVKTVFMSKMTWWTARCICRHENSATH